MIKARQKKIIDQYFDTKDFALTKNDIWLRKRGDLFELRIPLAGLENESKNKYQEIEGEEKIREIFAIPRLKSFIEDIANFGYDSFFQIETSSIRRDFILERKIVLEYLKKEKPDHYRALVEAGVVKQDQCIFI